MTAMDRSDREPITWWKAEPRRLERDQSEITARFSGLVWNSDGAGTWTGVLPCWPFDRPQPPNLSAWVGEEGLRLTVAYNQAYPMVEPALHPLDPLPPPQEWTQTRWHVNGDGTLCLLQEHAWWTGRDSLIDLLLKAAGWRLEYALMRHGIIQEMSRCGIVSDNRHDHLFSQPPPAAGQPDTAPVAGQADTGPKAEALC